MTPQQQLRRARFESLIRLMAPFLDFVLAAGEQVSRVLGPEDDYIPIRASGEGFELPPPQPQGSGDSGSEERSAAAGGAP